MASTFKAGLAVCVLVATGTVHGAQRTFVSTQGVDNPACSLVAPCRAFAAAIAATSSGGEVIVLDSGGYGPVAIAQGVAITAPPGIYAGISVFSGDGITITTTGAATVRLSGLTINNQGSPGSGIQFTGSGNLIVENTSISGFNLSFGLHFAPSQTSKLAVRNSSFSGNNTGFGVQGTVGTVAEALFDSVLSTLNGSGATADDNSNVIIRNSVLSNNASFGLVTDQKISGSTTDIVLENSDLSTNGSNGLWTGDPTTPIGTTIATLNNCVLSYNGLGLRAGDKSTNRVAGTTISRNNTGIAYNGSAVVQSQGNNFIYGNVTDGAAPSIVGSK